MSSLYTPEIREFIYRQPWPQGLIMDIYEDNEPAPHLNIVFFRDNWLTLEADDHLKITAIVKDVMSRLWSDGIPTYVGKMESAVHG